MKIVWCRGEQIFHLNFKPLIAPINDNYFNILIFAVLISKLKLSAEKNSISNKNETFTKFSGTRN